MNKKSTSVRLDEESRAVLEVVSRRTGVSMAKLLTLAVAEYVARIEKTGRITFPVKDSEGGFALKKVAEGKPGYGNSDKPAGGRG